MANLKSFSLILVLMCAFAVSVLQIASHAKELPDLPNSERIKDIALNSREVRLVGPDQKEVDMKDDLPTKFLVAMENLQKETSEVLGQVNTKLDKAWTDLKRTDVFNQVNDRLDKGWTEFKSIIEGVVAPPTKNQNRGQ